MKKWVIKHKIVITFFSILTIYLVLAGIFMPLDSYDVTCGMAGGADVIVRHELIFGGSLDSVKANNQPETFDTLTLYPQSQCPNDRPQKHELFLL